MIDQDHALIYKWILGNSFAGFGLFIAWQQGWLAMVVASDESYLSIVMAAVFGAFWIISTTKAITLDREIKRFRASEPQGVAVDYMAKVRELARTFGKTQVDQTTLANTLQARMLLTIQPVNFIANLLILLGLVGTVIGFVIAVGGLGLSLADHDNAQSVQKALTQIVNGMGVALFTTLVGSILGGIWLQVHYQLLFGAASRLALDIIEHAELDLVRRDSAGDGTNESWPMAGLPLASGESAGT